MKKILIVSIVMVFIPGMMNAQDSTLRKRVNPHMWYTLYNNAHREQAKLFEAQDSFLMVSKSGRLSDYYSGNFETTPLKITLVESVLFWNRHNLLLGMLAGAVTGFVIGNIVGQSEKDDPEYSFFYTSAREKAQGDMIAGTFLGCAIGALCGTLIKVEIPIHGSFDNYNKNKARLEKRSIKYKYLSGK